MDQSAISSGSFKHSSAIQIRFADADLAGHVNNAVILSYFETARVAFLDEMIGKENDWKSRSLILARTEVDYLKPIYLNDDIKVYSRISRIGSKSFTMENLLVKTDQGKEIPAARASFVLVCMDYIKKQTIEIPPAWKQKFQEEL
ncbi:MAG: acyl-CoA thioesterase [Bacteroidia bacterium]